MHSLPERLRGVFVTFTFAFTLLVISMIVVTSDISDSYVTCQHALAYRTAYCHRLPRTGTKKTATNFTEATHSSLVVAVSVKY